MVAVFNKELISWYLIILKLKQTFETGIQNAQPNSRSIDFPETSHAQKNKPTDVDPQPPESEWVIAVKEKLEQARTEDDSGAWSKLFIYRIPQCLRDIDDKAYIPQTVSLGPYHHGRKRLRGMDRHKWRAVYRVLGRTNHRIELYLDAVKAVEDSARACYEGPISLSSNEFAEMMVLDSCFVLELFRGADAGFASLGYSRNDPIFAMRGTMHSIQRDMIMLENQVPLFVLDKIFGLQSGIPRDQKGAVARLAVRFFDPLIPTDEPLKESDRDRDRLESSLATFDPLTELGSLHCLEVFRRSLLAVRAGLKPAPRVWFKRWSNTGRVADKRRQQLVHCVTELKEAGIKFKRRNTDRFWDIKFNNGVLKLPRLVVHDGTKSLFLNLIAFEQCQLDCTSDVTSYAIFMDNLIDSPADVSYLHYCGIIENCLGSDAEVAELFNRLCREVVFDRNDSSLWRLSEQVNRYYKRKWNAWRAILRHRYFNNPWSIIAFLSAVVLVVLTLAQTFYTVYAYYAPSS